MFNDTLIRDVRDRNDIVEVIGDYVSLKRAGSGHKGLCPFHGEKTPSFTVNRDRGFFYCFGCQAKGDVITFVREMNGYSFVEALRHLADRAGVELPDPTPKDQETVRRERARTRKKQAVRDTLYEAGRVSQRFFSQVLTSMEGQACQDYLRSRQITPETRDRFGLGFAPESWERIERLFKDEGLQMEVALKAGLVAPRRSGQGVYDRFRNRLMFPIRNLAGEVIAYSGRTLSTDKEVAKYVNSPETPVFTKGHTLFGLYEARKALRLRDLAVVVEGNVDLLRLAQEGLEEVVAPLGTALTAEQCGQLRRLVNRTVLLYDGDRAGRAATLKAIPLALAAGLQVAVVTLPDGDDPDTFVQREGIEALRALIDDAPPAFTHLIDSVIDETRARTDVRGKTRAIDRLAPVLESIEDRRDRQLYGRQLAGALELPERDLWRFAKDARTGRKRRVPQATTPQPVEARPPEAELKLLLLLLTTEDACTLFAGHDLSGLMGHDGARQTANDIIGAREDDTPFDALSILKEIQHPTVQDALYQRLADHPPSDDWRDEFEQLVAHLRTQDLNRRSQAADRNRHQAQMANDEGAQHEALAEKLKLQRQREQQLQSHRG